MNKIFFSLFLFATISSISEQASTSDEKVCYEVFGCFSLKYPWNSKTRPINLAPQPPQKINPKYCLYTKHNPKACHRLEINNTYSVYSSDYARGSQLYVIAHGFLEHGNNSWIESLTAELLKRSPCNVIVIDWSGGSGPPYTQAVANIRLVGVMTAYLLNMISTTTVDLDLSRTHVIGHSLGGHLASYIGTTLRRVFNQRLGRITGLDPAEPHFSKTETIVRLDPSDAIFVDNIHTDAVPFISGGLGMTDPIGHIDFYPNGGNNQPGCDIGLGTYVSKEDGSLLKGMKKMVGCNHVRSYQYFIESVNSPQQFLAIECESWAEFQKGNCFTCKNNNTDGNSTGKMCARFGFHSIEAFSDNSGIYAPTYNNKLDLMLTERPKRRFVTMYLITSSQSPFAKSQYKVSIKISDSSHEFGLFKLKITGSENSTEMISFTSREMYYESGSTHTRVVAGRSVGNIDSVSLVWTYRTSFFNPLTWRMAKSVISVEYVTVTSLETGESYSYCLPEDLQLISNSPVAMNSSIICQNELDWDKKIVQVKY